MRIGILTASLGPSGGGVEAAAQGLASALRSRGDVDLTVYGSGDEPTHATDRVFKTFGPAQFGFQPKLQSTLENDGLDLLHTHGLWMYPSIAGRKWAGNRRPYVVSPHGMLEPWALRNSSWKKSLAARFYEDEHLRGAACLHALNRAEAEAIRSYGITNPVGIVPNGVALPVLKASSQSKSKICAFLGRLHPKKGLPGLLRAWATLPPHDWKLEIAGWDQHGHQQELQALARRLRIERSVNFAGPKFGQEKAQFLRQASAFILPSFSEGLPVAVLEAWSYGLPVLMTLGCNLPEGFAAGAALPLELEDLSRGLSALLNLSADELDAIGRRGRRLVEKQFSWTRVAEDMTAVYTWVLSGGPKPECVVQ
jgi:glycosyltransferase involved in cell wall biosynthesis